MPDPIIGGTVEYALEPETATGTGIPYPETIQGQDMEHPFKYAYDVVVDDNNFFVMDCSGNVIAINMYVDDDKQNAADELTIEPEYVWLMPSNNNKARVYITAKKNWNIA